MIYAVESRSIWAKLRLPSWIALVLLVLAFPAPGRAQNAPIFHVPADFETIGAALESVPDHAIIEITQGDYPETLIIERPVTLRGVDVSQVHLSGDDAEPVIQIVGTTDVVIESLTIVGGKYGIFVTRSQDVTIDGNVIADSRLVGIKVRLAAATIRNNTVREARPPYGVGIHVTNTTQWPASHLIGNTVADNALSGIVTNMTGMIYVEDNIVVGNQLHGILINEMSHAAVADNIVDRNAGNGIYVFDMSMASVCGNAVKNTRPLPSISSTAYGNGIVIDFHSEAEVHDNIVVDNANRGIQALFGSQIIVSTNEVQRNGMNDLPKYTVHHPEADSGNPMCEEHDVTGQ